MVKEKEERNEIGKNNQLLFCVVSEYEYVEIQ